MFSVVMPVWNKRHTIRRTVASVLAQQWQGLELILVDDGSTDGSLDLLADIADPRLRICRQEKSGPGPARNRGIEAARHDWIAFLDADDLWTSGHLAELDRIRRLCPDADLIGTSWVRGSSLEAAPDAVHPRRIGYVDYFAELGRGVRLLWTGSAAIPRRVYQEKGGFLAVAPGQDSEYWARIALDRPVAVSTAVTAIYVPATGGITDTSHARAPRTYSAVADLSPAVALVTSQRCALPPERQEGVDGFIQLYLGWRIAEAAERGAIEALRQLARLPRAPRHLSNRLLLRTALLPAILARPLLWAIPRLAGRLDRLRRTPEPRLAEVPLRVTVEEQQTAAAPL